ncbi:MULTISPECIES: WXG100 family type VII secretion target [unclassified Streptosporangium]|uniref:WXG100 family type VII secretion target n=1 Tax=Streptosporangium sp. NPDC005286 TaxID=3154463 RepID=UPI0033A7B4FD
MSVPDPREPTAPIGGSRPPLKISSDHLRSVANAFDTEKEELADIVRQAAAELNDIGDFWGGGPEGRKFFKGQGGGTGYEAVSSQVMRGTDALLQAHEDIPALIRLMNDTVKTADWAGVTAILSALPAPDVSRPVWGEPNDADDR